MNFERGLLKKKWVVFPQLLAVIATLWFGGGALVDLWRYSQLKVHTHAEILKWEVQEKGSKYFVAATYFFEVGEKRYEQRFCFTQPIFLNYFSAEAELQQWQKYSWSVWYNPKAPHVSALQKLFPSKRVSYALVSLGICLYFLFFPAIQRWNCCVIREK